MPDERVVVTPTASATAGALLTAVSLNTAGISIPDDGRTMLVVVNGAGAPINVTIKTTRALPDGAALPDRVIAVTNATAKLLGPFLPSTHAQASGGIHIDFSSITTITVYAFYKAD
jgi:hypothetical protein